MRSGSSFVDSKRYTFGSLLAANTILLRLISCTTLRPRMEFNMGVRLVLLASLLSFQLTAVNSVFAAKPAPAAGPEKLTGMNVKALLVPEVTDFTEEEFKAIASAYQKSTRKVASEMTFSEADLSPDFVKFRDQFLAAKNADQISQLLQTSYDSYKKYSPDLQFFLAQMHVIRHHRGLVWRLRPLFETGRFLSGSKATHVMAVQFVRDAVTGLSATFPHAQTDAMIEYFTVPSKEMSINDQFKSVAAFQQFLAQVQVPALDESVLRMKTILTANPTAIWKWDNKIFYGTGSFRDGIKRVNGFGAAEMHAAIGLAYSAVHDALIFCAYNQDAIIDVAGELGRSFGIDASVFAGAKSDLGLTDSERSEIVKNAIARKRFLELRNYEGKNYGTSLMSLAYTAKKNSVLNMAEAFDKVKGKGPNPAMAINPGFFQDGMQNRMNQNVENMKEVVLREAEVRDPITGAVVTVDLPNYYKNPPASLGVLMATGYEQGANEYEIKNNVGESLKVRNYTRGRAIAWNNSEWAKYVPSAKGQPASYMSEAQRVMLFSVGGNQVFGQVGFFVR